MTVADGDRSNCAQALWQSGVGLSETCPEEAAQLAEMDPENHVLTLIAIRAER